jgi:hypothetical protein
VQSLVALGARDVALRALTAPASAPDLRTRARFVLQQMHDAETVSALLAANGTVSDPATKRELLLTLARLYNTEGPWTGDWWGTHPSTVGPYFTPVTWEESARIKPVLQQSLLAATGDDAAKLLDAYVANRVLPAGAKALFAAVDASQRQALADALVGTSQVGGAAVPMLAQLDAKGPALHAAVVELLAGETAFDAATLPMARAAVFDTTLPAATRARVLTAFSQLQGDAGRDAATAVFAQLNPKVGAPTSNDPLEAAWRRWVGERLRNGQLDYFVNLAKSASDPAQRTLAYSVLVQVARNPRVPPAMREQIMPVLDAAWADPALTPRLVDAIGIMRVESQYTQQLDAYKAKQPAQGAKQGEKQAEQQGTKRSQ